MKKWNQSRTIIAGITAMVAGAVDALVAGGGWRAVVIAALGGLMVVLRRMTSTRVGR